MSSKREIITTISSGHSVTELHRLILTSSINERNIVVAAFKEHVQGLREELCPDSWQKAWNGFRAGRQFLRVTSPRCTECNGRGYSTRSMSRGSRVCLACGGTRRGRTVVVPVAAAPERAQELA